MRFLIPNSVLKPRLPDEMFADQVTALEAAGFECSLVSLDDLQSGKGQITPPPRHGEIIVYRGWMLDAAGYDRLVGVITACGAVPLTPTATYLQTHHLPNWYPLIKELTPETCIFRPEVSLTSTLARLGWDRFFIKDYVKSLKTSVGAIIDSPAKAELVASEMKKYCGAIEGGFCVRRVEDFVPDSEVRYIVIRGQPFSPCAKHQVPAIVAQVAERIPSPFFSVDIALRSDGQLRVVEVGDGQVSDIVGWTSERLAEVWRISEAEDPDRFIS